MTQYSDSGIGTWVQDPRPSIGQSHPRIKPQLSQNPSQTANREPTTTRSPRLKVNPAKRNDSHGAHSRAVSGRTPGRIRAADHLRQGVARAADVCGEEGGVACA